MNPAVRTRDPGRVRPIFVWLLAIVVGPIVVLFGVGMLNEIRGPAWPIVAIAYLISAIGAPTWFVFRARNRGAPTAKAIAMAFAMASVTLLIDVPVVAFDGGGFTSAVVTGVVAGAMVWICTSIARALPQAPPRPDLGP